MQKITPYRYEQRSDGSVWVAQFQGFSVLDTSDPYGSVSSIWPTGSGWQVSGDSPRSPLNDIHLITLNDSFNTYLMYRPPGANPLEYEWVPLMSESWSYKISVVLMANGTWGRAGNPPAAPWTSVPAFARTTQEPEWDNRLYGNVALGESPGLEMVRKGTWR